MKTIGGFIAALAFCLASGVEQNPIQGIYALVLMGAAWWCFHLADARTEHTEKAENTESINPVNKKAA